MPKDKAQAKHRRLNKSHPSSERPRSSSAGNAHRSHSSSRKLRPSLIVDDIVKGKLQSFMKHGGSQRTSLEDALTKTNRGFRKSNSNGTDSASMISVSAIICIPLGYNEESYTLNQTKTPSHLDIINLEACGMAVRASNDSGPIAFGRLWDESRCLKWLREQLPDVFRYADAKGLKLAILGKSRSTLGLANVSSINGKALFDLPEKSRIQESKLFIAFSGSIDADTYRDYIPGHEKDPEVISRNDSSDESSAYSPEEFKGVQLDTSESEEGEESEDFDDEVQHPRTRSVSKTQVKVKSKSAGLMRHAADGNRSTPGNASTLREHPDIEFEDESRTASSNITIDDGTAAQPSAENNEDRSESGNVPSHVSSVPSTVGDYSSNVNTSPTSQVADFSTMEVDVGIYEFDEPLNMSSLSYVQRGDGYYRNVWASFKIEDYDLY